MSRHLPSDVAALLRPTPTDFLFKIEDHGHYLRWSATLDVDHHGQIEVELGFHGSNGHSHLRASAWQAMELARIGRLDLLSHCRVDRHKARRKG